MGKFKALSGVVCSEVEYKLLPFGDIVKFHVKEAEQHIWCCLGKGDVVETCRQNFGTPAMGVAVTIRGALGNGEKEIWINAIFWANAPRTLKEQLIKTYGSYEKYQESRKAWWGELERKGLVPTIKELPDGPKLLPSSKEESIHIDGRWQNKLEFVMNELGEARINSESKKFWSEIKDSMGALTHKKGTAKFSFPAAEKWRALIDEWVAEALSYRQMAEESYE